MLPINLPSDAARQNVIKKSPSTAMPLIHLGGMPRVHFGIGLAHLVTSSNLRRWRTTTGCFGPGTRHFAKCPPRQPFCTNHPQGQYRWLIEAIERYSKWSIDAEGPVQCQSLQRWRILRLFASFILKIQSSLAMDASGMDLMRTDYCRSLRSVNGPQTLSLRREICA